MEDIKPMEELILDEDFEEDAQEDIRQGKYMTFKVGREVFGVELKYVNEIIQIQTVASVPNVEDYIKGLINLRGKIIPVIDVAIRFRKDTFEYTDRTCIIVIAVNGVEVGLIVENIGEVVSIEEEDILPPPNMHHCDTQERFVKGIGKIGEEVKLLLDPVKLLSDDALDFMNNQENEEEE